LELKGSPVAQIFVLSGARKSVGKDSPIDVVKFDLPFGLPSRRFEPDAKPADAGADFSKGVFIVH
jgi:hypothetical protein